jgi:hypothetical protein
MKRLICEGCCEALGGCYGPLRVVVVSRIGEMRLCAAAKAGFEAAGYVVSDINVKYSDNDSLRPDVDEEILRQLGHFLK